jgi:serine/threonine protein kinase
MGISCCRGSSDSFADTGHQIRLSERLTQQLGDINFDAKADAKKTKFRTDEEVKTMYKIQKKVGQGLFSKVFFAVDASGLKVALKVIPKKDVLEEVVIQKILIEKELLIKLNHPNVLKLYRTIQSNFHIYIVLEYCDKGTLAGLANCGVRFAVSTYRIIAAQIIEALGYLHSQGVVYGDLKAENVLVNQYGVLKLGDFNLSATSSLLDNKIQGTISYIAPEVLIQNRRSEKSDWWALGVLLHYLFYGTYPFRTKNQAEMLVNIYTKSVAEEQVDNKAPPVFRSFILALLEKDPKKRLGDNNFQIKKHPFFKDFDWKGYAYDQSNFEYAQHLTSQCLEGSPVRSMGQANPDWSLSDSNSKKFYYNIENFTYDNQEELQTKTSFIVPARRGGNYS